MQTIFRFLKPYRRWAILAPLCMTFEAMMDLMQPLLMASIVDKGIIPGDMQHVLLMGALMVLCATLGWLGGVGCSVFAIRTAVNVGGDLRDSLFRKVQTFSYRNLDHISSGSLVTRLTSDVAQVQQFVQMMLRMFVRAPAMGIGALIMAFFISPRLSLILFVVVPLIFVVLFLLIRTAIPRFGRVQERLDHLNMLLQDSLAGMRIVKAFVRGESEKTRFGLSNQNYCDTAIIAWRLISLNTPFAMLMLNATIVALLWIGGLKTLDGSMPPGDLVAFINYTTAIMMALSAVGMLLMNITAAKVSIDRINDVFAEAADVASPDQPLTATLPRGAVRFEDVSFSYGKDEREEEDVLRHISFSAEPGQTVALLGATGSGKSTLVSLIPRLYDPRKGRVLIDGIDLRDMDLSVLRGQIGFVMQEGRYFSGSVRDNLCYGKPDANDEDVIAAAKMAQAHDFISALPQGYATLLGQRGVNLSGGQRQRLSIARALLLKPRILILDDSTSAVDMKTESRIRAALDEVMADATCFVIAQRVAAIMDADKIIVLEDGEIVAQGKHAQLLADSAIYREIYESQQGTVSHE